jgi:hypothetical protein
LVLETKLKEEQQLREEIVESFQTNTEKFEAKIFEFDDFKEKMYVLKRKFTEEDSSEFEDEEDTRK